MSRTRPVNTINCASIKERERAIKDNSEQMSTHHCLINHCDWRVVNCDSQRKGGQHLCRLANSWNIFRKAECREMKYKTAG